MIIFGLGNPGEEYLLSRHNIGFMTVDAVAIGMRSRFKIEGEALVSKGSYKGCNFSLVKPLSYMNLSGRVVRDYLKRNNDGYLVVVDDVDLPFGTLRIRKQGGDGGHNGLASVIEYMGTEDFARMRVGVGPRPEGCDLSDYVLSSFSRDELKQLPWLVDISRDAVLLVIKEGIDIAMNEVNRSKNQEQ
ncbi:aminoacyl-tRNA hydrolase [bacterium]|nr:aminoacyl-tRNA hydrolase [bacterium]